ncbi:hypothetical protein FNW52_02660 [Flavobacterium sp. ZT3R18]|uniref:hypothetical protein n=1 Tax=Flavobacterium sp. ZT3R18 TaxID=2594429 RepID=UPI00117BA941|nr:hypothetical protein [Flavobacterium sp. ZT3R18]TRX37817.1 hypothetical protein FNW52_02660 [Flavobacterium sp. ZT3R18]
MVNKNNKIEWSEKDAKSLTENFINHIDEKYYESYKSDSEYYEKINNRLFAIITIIGFLVTITIGLKGILKIEDKDALIFTIISFILPSVSSVILLYMNNKGFKRKEELREDARIQCKYLVNEAKIRFSTAKENVEFENIYKWLNEEVKKLQLSQANDYFVVHNNTYWPTQTENLQKMKNGNE